MSAQTKYVEAREKWELKEKAIKYYQENGVPAKMEEVLNSMFYEDPEDVYGHLVSNFYLFKIFWVGIKHIHRRIKTTGI